ncbi:MAG: cupin domain-containing protein [Pseudomonadota bacterium]
MKQKLHKDLNDLFSFYQQQRQNLPDAFGYRGGVINKPSFYTLKIFQEHLNNPLLQPEWLHVKRDGRRVELEKSCFYKTVQNRKLHFMDKDVLNHEINKGAAMVLEGIDILDAQVNAFVSKLDDSLPCVIANSVVFFSQQDNEAYEGHCDADDVLVVQLEGRKTWQLFAPQQRRYAGITDLSDQQLGPVMQEISMRPGDALYLRAGVPHRCITSANFSLHMSFDLCDSTPTTSEIAQEATNQYRHACELPYESASKVVDRYVSILNSEEFQAALDEATRYKREDIKQFRELIGRSSVLRSLNKFS